MLPTDEAVKDAKFALGASGGGHSIVHCLTAPPSLKRLPKRVTKHNQGSREQNKTRQTSCSVAAFSKSLTVTFSIYKLGIMNLCYPSHLPVT